MTDPLFAKGNCSCGAVSLIARSKPKMMVQCHCLDCQKATGTGHTSMAYFDIKDLTIEGETTAYTVMADSGNKMTRNFCPRCGSRMFGTNSDQPHLISVQVGCLEDHSWFSPQAIVFASRRNKWDITSDEVPNYDKMPPAEDN